jgi:hypothetical protein
MTKRNDEAEPVAEPSRRRFMQEIALGSAAVVLGPGARARASATDAGGLLVDAASQAPEPVAVASLPPRARIHPAAEISGMPLGGIGTGSVEVRSDGYFHEWMIFNVGPWAQSGSRVQLGLPPEMDPGALAFFLRTQSGDEAPLVRRLGTRGDQNELYSLSWARNVEAIEYDAAFPAATLRYVDATLPVTVAATMFSPFVPHDARTSGTPGFHAAFAIKNTTGKRVRVSFAAKLANPLAWGAADRALKLGVVQDGKTTYLTMRTNADLPQPSTVGSLGLSVTGGEASWIAGEFPQYVGNGFWGEIYASFLNDFRATGRLPSLDPQQTPAALLQLTDDQVTALSRTNRRSRNNSVATPRSRHSTNGSSGSRVRRSTATRHSGATSCGRGAGSIVSPAATGSGRAGATPRSQPRRSWRRGKNARSASRSDGISPIT